jgi:two-component system, chemotaxis family, CheB/CheR fusion protein
MTRILLVEDSTDILLLLQTELEWIGYTVDVASDALAGLELAGRNRPNVIVSDLHMPDIDGCEFIRRVRQTRGLAGIPAIALTGYSREKEVNLALAAGFDAHLTKPVDGKTISEMITRMLAKRMKKAS